MEVKKQFSFAPLYFISSAKGQKGVSPGKTPFFSLSQTSERLAVRFPLLARLYFNLFYKSMLAKEEALAGLKPGACVLHIGSGAYPFTALYLAQKGYTVHACDCNIKAVEKSRKLVEKNGLADRVKILYENGCLIDSAKYDAVWVSLNICPKKRVLEQTWASLKSDSVLVYRNMPAWMERFGRSNVVLKAPKECRVEKARSGLGAESLIMFKESTGAKSVASSRSSLCLDGSEKISAFS